MILSLVEEAVHSGARQSEACKVMELPPRTLQRWRSQGSDGGEDRRRGPTSPPRNKLSSQERSEVLRAVNSEEMRDLSPR
jgi:transposase-like protein